MKDNSTTLSLTFDEFCHIRNVITRAELETLLFDEKLYTEVAQGKVKKFHQDFSPLTNTLLFSVMFHLSESPFSSPNIHIWNSM